ncbi:MAG: dihydropteroate synthase [Acidobacteriota bacterium]
MGIVNITPDSFSDGGRFLAADAAIEHGLELIDEGAEILDLGAESTRPGGGVYGSGAVDVPVDEELRRLLPVIAGLRQQAPNAILSVDTRKGVVARRVLDAGADLINDVGGLQDPDLISAVADAGVAVIAMHSRGALRDMQRRIHFDKVVTEVRRELAEALDRARIGGVPEDHVILDPGIGFGKGQTHNLALIRHLDTLGSLGRPLLLGASRKSFIAKIAEAEPTDRLGGSLAAAAWAARHGAAILRVHDVAATSQFLKVWHAIDSAPADGDESPSH